MLLVAIMATSRAPDLVRYGIFAIEFSKNIPSPEVASGADYGEVYQQSAFSVNTYPAPLNRRAYPYSSNGLLRSNK